MPMHRFFVSSEVLATSRVVLGEPLAHRMGQVLRLHAGDRVVLLDNSGWEYDAELTRLGRDTVEARIAGKRPATGEPALGVHLYQGLLKADKFELVLQKGTELGIASFTPVASLRSVAAPPAAARQERWERILREAAEQSRRGRRPPLHPAASLSDALSRAPGLRLLPWEEEHSAGLRQTLEGVGGQVAEVSLFIGPEGGWAEEEVALARKEGALPLSLGPRVLRAETAGLAAAAAILYHFGEMG